MQNTTKGPDSSNPNLPRLFVRPGAIIPTGPVMEFVGQANVEPLTLIVNIDSNGRAEGSRYDDQGDGYAYQKGDYRLTTYSARLENDAIVITSTAEGRRAGVSGTIEVRALLDGREVVKSFKAGQPMTITLQP
jgi:alpha-glucosidase